MLSTFEPINIVFFPQTQVLLSLFLTVGAIILFRRVRRSPALLILIGAFGYFVMHLSNAVSAYTISDTSFRSPALVWWWNLVDNISGVATVFLPIGLFAFALSVARASNQSVELTATRRALKSSDG